MTGGLAGTDCLIQAEANHNFHYWSCRKDLTQEERDQVIADIVREITALWQTDELRRQKPTALDGGQTLSELKYLLNHIPWLSMTLRLQRHGVACILWSSLYGQPFLNMFAG